MFCPRLNLKTCVTCLCLKNCSEKLSTSSKFAKSHYDSLGITPAATQAQIKSAYYKLSKLHHPDRNLGSEESSTKFREVSAAYEVLGNVKLRKMYDKGLISQSQSHSYTEHPQAKFYRSRDVRTRPPPDGKTPIYDFDEWSKQHYGATFAKNMRLKEHRRMQQRSKEFSEFSRRNEIIVAASLAIMAIIFMVFTKTDYDQIQNNKKTR